jgi:hypothetical protein
MLDPSAQHTYKEPVIVAIKATRRIGVTDELPSTT